MNDKKSEEYFSYNDIDLEDTIFLNTPPSKVKIVTLEKKDVYGEKIWFGKVILGWADTNTVEAKIAVSRKVVAANLLQPVCNVKNNWIYNPSSIQGLNFLSWQSTKTSWKPIIELLRKKGYQPTRRKSWGSSDKQKVTKKYYEKLLLKPELVPTPLWGKSLYNALNRDKRWRAIRKKVLIEALENCQICKNHYEKGMICHEKWEYNDKNLTSTLTGFELVCPDCNAILHYGRSAQIIAGTKNPEKAVELFVRREIHMERINQLSKTQCKLILSYATEEHKRRSSKRWKIIIPPSIRKQFPEIKGVRIK